MPLGRELLGDPAARKAGRLRFSSQGDPIDAARQQRNKCSSMLPTRSAEILSCVILLFTRGPRIRIHCSANLEE